MSKPTEVWLVTSPAGLAVLRERLGHIPSPIWFGGGVASVHLVAELRSSGLDLSVFEHALDVDDSSGIAEAAATVEEHHPGLIVRVI